MRSKLLFLMLAVGLLYLPAIAQAGENILYNPSFEIPDSGDDAGRPDEWGLWGSDLSWGGDSTEEFLTNAAEARTGSVYGHCRAGATGGDYAGVFAFDEITPVVPGKQYYFGFWAKDLLPGGNPSAGFPVIQIDMFEGVMKVDAVRHMEYRVTYQIDIPRDGKYHYIEGLSIVIPAEIGSIQSEAMAFASSEYNFDDGYIGLTPFSEHPVYDPVPDDGAQGVNPTTTQLSWSRLDCSEPNSPAMVPMVEVWWGVQAEPNFWYLPGEAVKIMDLADVETFDLGDAIIGAITLSADEEYFWALKYEDPNDCNFGAGLKEGPGWSFDTINRPPTVDAGLHYDRWQDGGASPIKIGIDASYSDDGLPIGGNLTYTWTETLSGGATVPTYIPSRTVEDPNVIFTTTGDYLLKLTIHDNDGGAQDESGEDTTLIRIFGNGDDRLRAHYPLDTNANDIVGGHNGTLEDNPVFNPSGQVSGAIELDGTDDVGGDGLNDHVSIGDTGSDPNFQSDTWENSDLIDGMTVSAWMKLDANGWSTTWEAIVAKNNSSWELQRNGGSDNVRFVIQNGIGQAMSSGATDVEIGWHQVVGVYDRNTIKIYVDGLESGSGDAGELDLEAESNFDYLGQQINDQKWQVTKAPGKIRIGAGSNVGNDLAFAGLIDQVRIFDAAVPYRAEHSGTPGIVEMYRADGGHDNCGGVYIPGDENEDCYVTLADFALAAQYWLQCNDAATAECD